MTAGGRHRQGGGHGGLLLWLCFLAGTVVGLHALGGQLEPPPLTDPGGLGDWLDGRQPAEAAFAVLRLLALGLAWYLLAATVAGTLTRLSRVAALVRAADVFTIPTVRRIVNASAGLTLAAATLAGTAGTAAGADDRVATPAAPEPAVGAEVITQLPEGHDDPAAPLPSPLRPSEAAARPAAPADAPPTLRRLPDEPGPVPPAPRPSSETPSPPDQEPRRWEIRPGQHFWAVAEEVLAAAWQRPPTDAEIDPYWRVMIETNREILRDPANPDLLYPGQVLTVPPPPPPDS